MNPGQTETDRQETPKQVRILVIEDNQQTRRMLCMALTRQDYEVVEAQDGREGIRRYREAPTDIILTDILMPEKEGLETIMELRRDFPTVKIIAMSGGLGVGQVSFLAMAEKLGAQHVLRKPFSLQEMFEALTLVLHGKG